MEKYELVEHTADIGIRVFAKDLRRLFITAASAMFDIIAGPLSQRSNLRPKKLNIKIQAADREELFVEWLNELLSLSAVKDVIFSEFQIGSLKENQLEAVVLGYSKKNYSIKTEIKAATYYELKIEKTKEGFQAEVIFDV